VQIFIRASTIAGQLRREARAEATLCGLFYRPRLHHERTRPRKALTDLDRGQAEAELPNYLGDSGHNDPGHQSRQDRFEIVTFDFVR
jgi:hypothetical protein